MASLKSLLAGKPPRLVTGPDDLKGLTSSDRIVLIGPKVAAQINGSPGEAYLDQPTRKGVRGMSTAPVPITLGIDHDLAKALFPVRFSDVRLAYDGFISYCLGQSRDVVLVAGHATDKKYWVTAIAKIGRAIVEIKEAALEHPTHRTFNTELRQFVEDFAGRHASAKLVVATPGHEIKGVDHALHLHDQLHLRPPLRELNLGAFRFPVKFLAGPALVMLAGIAYGAFAIYSGQMVIKKQQQAYRAAISGIEAEFKKGSPLVERLENRRAFLTSLQDKPDLGGITERLLRAAAASGDALLVSSQVFKKSDLPEFKLRMAILPDVELEPIEQGAPYLTRLAANFGSDVRLNKYSDDRFGAISPTIGFRTYEMVGVARPAPAAVEAAADTGGKP